MKILAILSLIFVVLLPNISYAIAPDDKEAILGNYPFYDATDAGGTCSGGSFSLSGSNNLEKVWNYFLARNFTPEQTAGIMGNLLVETKGTLDPRIKQGGSFMSDPNDPDVSGGEGRGIAQWSYNERWQSLLNYAAAPNPERNPFDLNLQLDFIMFEMTGEPPAPGMTGGTGNAGTAFDMLRAMTSTGEQAVEEAAVIFARYYEVNQFSIDYAEGRKSYEEAFRYRIDPALAVYADLAGTGTTGITCGPGGGVSFEIIEGDTTDIPCQGNILDEADVVGYKDGAAYNIKICQIAMPNGSAGPWVNSQISGAYSQMAISAYATGVSVDGSGYRTNEGQMDARIRNCPSITSRDDPDMNRNVACNPPTAIPGHSNHQMGFAVDMDDIPVSCPTEIQVNGERFCQNPNNTTWQWLTAHASSFGLYQLSSETWHWSIDGH